MGQSVSPLPIQLARPLIDSLTSDVVVADGEKDVLRGTNQSLEESIGYAFSGSRPRITHTLEQRRCPGDELGAAMPDPVTFWAGGRMFVDQRSLVADSMSIR